MSLGRYVQAPLDIAEELLQALSEGEIEALRGQCAEMRAAGFLGAVGREREEALRFLQASPAARAKRVAWKDDARRPLLILVAVYLAREGRRFLERVERHALFPGRGYRDMTSEAAEAAWDFRLTRSYLWPLDGEDPFGEK
jgi:hypothetical protein